MGGDIKLGGGGQKGMGEGTKRYGGGDIKLCGGGHKIMGEGT